MKNMNLVLDIGNTNIIFGFYKESRLLSSWRFQSDTLKTEDEYYAMIKVIAADRELDLKKIKITAMSSVVPELTNTFLHLIEKYLDCSCINVNAYTDLGLKFPVPDPGFIGSDLIVNAYSAINKYKENCIICDFGTATTIQLISKKGFFYGTAIIPGVITSTETLFKKASQLSGIKIKETPKIIGTNTEDALLAGILKGNSLMTDGFIDKIKEEYKNLTDIKVIATGGIAKLICKYTTKVDFVDPFLTLEGLNRVCNRN